MDETYYDATLSPTQIQFDGQAQLLDLVDSLRSNGVNHHIALPQLVVCGDQSAGKSSVLEAISRVQFPSKESLCTRFATEFVLRRSPNVRFAVSIRPGQSRSQADVQRLQGFATQTKFSDIASFVSVYEKAKECMGLRDETNHICDDVLKIEISGPQQPHLTLVDLPGIIHSEVGQQKPADIQLIKRLVDTYMKNPRSIILAVISAKNDVGPQAVLSHSSKNDPQQTRTLGIITKPDLIRPDSIDEADYLKIARNESRPLGLGWHVLKNRGPESHGKSCEQRDLEEAQFFQQGVWRGLDRSSVGVESLRSRLGRVLMQQIAQELPSLIQDIEINIKDCNETLRLLGKARNSSEQQRSFLTGISQDIQAIVRAATNGHYDHEFFPNRLSDEGASEEGRAKNLRAAIWILNTEFADRMYKYGHKYDIWDQYDAKSCPELKRLTTKIAENMRHSRGNELPTLYNPLLVGDAFCMQSSPWAAIANSHLFAAWDAVQAFMNLALSHVTNRETMKAVMSGVIDKELDLRHTQLQDKLVELLKPYTNGHAMTCQKSFAEVLKSVNNDALRASLHPELNKYLRRTEVLMSLDDALQIISDVTHNMENKDQEEGAAAAIIRVMQVYYKIALNTFIDNVVNLAIENVLLDGLQDMFCPSTVSRMSPDELQALASESLEVQAERNQAEEKLKVMEDSLRACRRYSAGAMRFVQPSTTGAPSEEHLKRYLRLIEDDLVYHRALPNLSVVVSPSEEDFFIKRPKLTFHGDSESAEILPRLMFEEAEILQKLSDIKHPNIVGFHGCTVRRGYITGLVLDRYPMTLSARLRKSAQTFDKTKCINDIRAGIEHLHSLEFAHNDLNPDNIVVDQKDKSVLIDIGSCRAFGAMLITAGTPGWVDDEDFVTSDRKHDDIAMQKLVAWLDEQC
ncbi:hypothetical protein MBLNU459_g7598t1 [Dothideomycetes sp. NU459]